MTTDRNKIQNWVEERDGYPARVVGTDGKSGGLIRIDYEGYTGQGTLERITWEEWFAAFEKNNLAFLHQDEVKGGGKSRFSKLIDRDSQEAGGR